MKMKDNLIAIYDFEFFPYALGDVLTWNIRTAMRCEELGRQLVDIYVCLDERYPASIYQRGLINPDNYELFFTELYSAFSTNPRLGNFFIFRNRELMLSALHKNVANDHDNLEALNDYLHIMQHTVTHDIRKKIWTFIESKSYIKKILKKIYHCFFPKVLKKVVNTEFLDESALNQYFIKYIYSHEAINDFYARYKHIPNLIPALGCSPDIEEIIARQFKGKKIVTFHLRLRRLDIGYGGDITYARDSDFLEWYDFLKQASIKYPHVQFITLGRLQEKALEILRLPNVTSLRIYGMGLGHELTMMLKSDLFIGTSSGFAALANFSAIPYFVTRMNPGSCQAYAIAEGEEYLPFANKNQKLVYTEETTELLLSLLEQGLGLVASESLQEEKQRNEISQFNLQEWLCLHLNPSNSARTTCRFYIDELYRHEETAYLLLPYLERARQAFVNKNMQLAKKMLSKLNDIFPEVCSQLPHYILLEASIAAEEEDLTILQRCLNHFNTINFEDKTGTILSLFKSISSSIHDKCLLVELRSYIEQLNYTEIAK